MIEFIAEAGQTMRGDVGRAVEMVDAFAEAGATHFKVQMLNPDTIATADAMSYWATGPSIGQRESFARNGVIPYDKWGPVKQACDDNAIGFIATPFDLDAVDALVDLDPAAVKIASGDITFVPLLRRVHDRFPDTTRVIVSTGAASWGEIEVAVDALWEKRVTWLACSLAYPCRLADARYGRIGWLQRELRATTGADYRVGYSDHTVEPYTGLYAALAGATVLEKHVTPNPGSDVVPDDAMGLGAEAFAAYVHYGNEGARLLGDHLERTADVELPAANGARRAARWACVPPVGSWPHAEDFTYLRPDPDGDGRSIYAAMHARDHRTPIARTVVAGEVVRAGDFG